MKTKQVAASCGDCSHQLPPGVQGQSLQRVPRLALGAGAEVGDTSGTGVGRMRSGWGMVVLTAGEPQEGNNWQVLPGSPQPSP